MGQHLKPRAAYRAVSGSALLLLSAGTLVACNGSGSSSAANAPTTSAAPVATSPASPSAMPAVLADFTSKSLAYARDTASLAGLKVTAHDASGRGRTPVVYSDWQVCSQSPAAGTYPADTSVDFAAVKTNETCPATAVPAATPAGSTMPALTGKGLEYADQALSGDKLSISPQDVSGKSRSVLLPSSWQVCTQNPAAGAPLSPGTVVRLGVVKYGESCP